MKAKSTQTMKDIPPDVLQEWSEADEAEIPERAAEELRRRDGMDPIVQEANDWASTNTTGEDVHHIAVRAYLAGRSKGIESSEELERLRAEVQVLREGTFALVKDRDTQFNLKQDIGARYNKLRARLIELGEDV